MPKTEMVRFADVDVEIRHDDDHEFLVTNAEVAALYDVPVKNLNEARRRNPDDLREGRQFLLVEQDHKLRSRSGGHPEVLWTKRGAIRISQHIRSPRGTAVQDWLEDLAIEALGGPMVTVGPSVDLQPLVAQMAVLTGEISKAVATGTEAMRMASAAHDRLVDTDDRLGHTEYRVGRAAGYVKTTIDPAIVGLDARVAALESRTPPAEESRLTGYQFTRMVGRHEVDRGILGLLAENEARDRGLVHEMRDVTYYRGGSGQVHAWPESTWRAALEIYDRRRPA